MGKFVDLAFNPVCRMSEVNRYSGVFQNSNETLSDHVADVSILSYLISQKLIREYGEDIDIGLLLEKCIVHDMDEVITGDIPRNTKYANKRVKSSMDEVASKSIRLLSDYLNNPDIVNTWELSKDGKEGFILKIVDMLDVAKKVISEVSLHHNLSFLKVVDELLSHLKDMISEFYNVDNKLFGNDGLLYLEDLVTDAYNEIKDIYDKYECQIDKYKIFENVLEKMDK